MKQSKLAYKLKQETAFMLAFIFPCNKTGQQIEDEKSKSCNNCKIKNDCIDYYSSQPNQTGKILDFKSFLYHRKRNKNRHASRKY